MKKRITYFIIMLCFFAFLPNLKASTSGYVTGDAVRIRNGASTDATEITRVYYGQTLTIIDTNPIEGSGCSKGWLKINYNGAEAYICSNYTKIGTINTGYNTSPFTARVYATTLSVRESASYNAAKLATLINGTNVLVTETLSSGSGCDDVWYKINYHDGQIGYVCGTYIINKTDVTKSDTEYERILEELGFPKSYHPYLVYLHNKYPNWQFKAINTGISWADVISGESGKNYIEGTIYDAYRVDANPREGSSWFESTDGVNAFFLDPRNFLTEKYIFMFENLQYDEATQGASIIKSIFGSSYLSEDAYVNYFINAGKTYNISPVHLASRVVQEGGAKSTYSAITGDSDATYRGNSLKGYYNYYNIGAYKDSYTSSPVTRGLAYAKGLVGGDGTSYGRPWDTREKAIMGGANFISSGYISAGQYTLYFEKFNTSPTSSYNKFTHQYMTNVQAPSSEASNIYSSYKDNGIISSPYVFAIPIYLGMPEVVSLPTIGDVVNSLSHISINGNALIGFDPDVVSYSYFVSKDTTSVNIAATATSSLANISGTGNISLDKDEKTVDIKVISQTGDEKVYSITFKKVSDSQTIEEILSNVDVKINGDNFSGLSEGTTVSTLISSIKKYGPSSNVIMKNSSGSPLSGNEGLSTGQTLTIQTSSNETKTFNIAVKGDTSGDGKVTILDLLQIQKDILNSKKLSGAYLIAADTSGDAKVTILDLLQVQKHIIGDKKL